MNKLWMIALGMMLASPTFAATKDKDDDEEKQRFPTRCYPQGFDYQHKVLHLYPQQDNNAQSMYFIHNISDNTIKLRQMRTGDEPFSLNHNNSIRPGTWGVFAGNQETIKFICTREKSGRKYGEIVDCNYVLDICEYPNVEFAIINRGSYWIVESASMRQAQRTATRKGAYLHGRDGV